MENAFKPGDPVLDLAAQGKLTKVPGSGPNDSLEDALLHGHWIPRGEQVRLDDIVGGKTKGHYYLLIGEKGVGKSSMLIDAMFRCDRGEGVAMFDAHADPEIFRIRLGKALDFEYHEDNIGSLFSIRGPRDASALLDIERAFNKLDKVALARREKIGRPLVLVINSLHLLRDDEEGRDMLELIQQRAETWAAANLCTVVMNSDDYWVYERLKQYATRMEVIPVGDLPKQPALIALQKMRKKFFAEDTPSHILDEVYNKLGGRLTYLNRVAQAKDMIPVCDHICRTEKTWFLNQCWILGGEMDDDVMDQQKYAASAMMLAKALVDKENAQAVKYDPERGHVLPEIPLHEARQIMTRADFIQSYDHINVFTIDSNAMVRADSVPMQRAFREVCGKEGFEEHLNATIDRIADIESLGRTREITIKDLWNDGKYELSVKDRNGKEERTVGMKRKGGRDWSTNEPLDDEAKD